MTGDKLRSAYLSFFKDKGHEIVPSASLVPENDPTTLFTGSGMQPMVPYLLGESHPAGQRIADSQKCFRSQDIEDVGDNRHTTFFEMLGNWSLGDYFKEAQLSWLFEFLTEKVGLDASRLYVSVYAGSTELGIAKDEESVRIWQDLFAKKGITASAVADSDQARAQGGRIYYYGESENWWSRSGEPQHMPAGEPGGPDSEVFFDFGSELKLHENSAYKDQPCHPACNCGRYMEIANSVFMQYVKQTDGSFVDLPQKNVDFGGGLERILVAANDNPDVFQSDLFQPIIDQLAQLTGRDYHQDQATTHSFRVIADHIKAATMLIGDGVRPGNKEQGYFLRRLLRRAVRYGKMIDIDKAFLADLSTAVIHIYQTAYPNLVNSSDQIKQVIENEEAKFARTLDRGLREFAKLASRRSSTDQNLTAAKAFELYETHGFPVELSIEIADQQGLALAGGKDKFLTDFARAKQQHAAASRQASGKRFKGGLQDAEGQSIKYHTATHLLHAALRKVLGDSVQQKGSNITSERLRFDFSFDRALTEEEKERVMQLVNGWIQDDLPVHRQEMKKEDALRSGAMAFFVEKYPDQVSVYTIGTDPDHDWVSKELCGGPHVQSTGKIGEIVLQKEQAVAAGVRRIYLK